MRKFPYFACALATNFLMNYELRTMNSLRDQMRKGLAQPNAQVVDGLFSASGFTKKLARF
jgi:hypothetical protein